MALSFVAGSTQLANWGFSVGDVAVLGGAGRKVTTWLLTNFKDRTLFEWLGVDVDSVLTRGNIIDILDLQRRWDKKVDLLQNGKKKQFTTDSAGGGAPKLQHMDRFTWLMTLFTAALDASMGATDMRRVLGKLLLKIFEETPSGEEYVRQSSPEHFEGWLSAAAVRGILKRTRDIWEDLAKRGKHQPGFIPGAEVHDVFKFLEWLATGQKEQKRYRTASTDVFSLALVLEQIGVIIKTTEDSDNDFDEGDIVVRWDSSSPYPMAMKKQKHQRRFGMRIPLHNMEEVGSLYPDNKNEVRSILKDAMDAVQRDGLRLRAGFADSPPYVQGSPIQDDQQDLVYTLESTSREPMPRLESDTFRLAEWLLLKPTPAVSLKLKQLIERIRKSQDEDHNLSMVALSLENQTQEDSRFHDLRPEHDYGEALVHVQTFILGYWYALLKPLLETSQLQRQEAFGSWAWMDIHCVNFIRQCVRTRMSQKTKTAKSFSMYRHEVLKLIAYLFGGSELSQVQSTQYGAVGILGKLPVVYSSLLGGCVQDFGKFTLIDVDATCFPSSSSGIVLPGQTHTIKRGQPKSTDTSEIKGFDMSILPSVINKTFTVHIEPDWEYDSSTCLVAYRYKGRIIHRLNPRQVDLALAGQKLVPSLPGAGWMQAKSGQESEMTEAGSPTGQDPPYHPSESYCLVPLDEFHGSFVVDPEERMADMADNSEDPPGYVFTPLVINVSGSSNALACLACMYEGWKGTYAVRVVRNKAEFESAIQAFTKVVISYHSQDS